MVEMTEVVFWGIHFRSVYHMRWFQGSCAYFLFTILILIVSIILLRRYLNALILPITFWFLGILGHCGMGLSAIFATEFGKINGDVMSVDCIWFNFLCGAIYIVMIIISLIVARLVRKRNPLYEPL